MADSLERMFAYGSNMDVDHLRSRIRTSGYENARVERSESAKLPGFLLVWNYYSQSRSGGAANVDRVANGVSPALALMVNNAGLAGHPNSVTRGDAPVPVRLAGGTLANAWVYVACVERRRAFVVPPTRAYLNIIVSAAERLGLSITHVETPTMESSHG